uniref:DUF1937 domain-containing protein n=1 Tax=viral metagenome TaxID=1070528 RepID=A0A6M3L2M8_9ZZZZ
MIKLYLASAYSDPIPEVVKENYYNALNAAVDLYNLGYVVYSPIVHCHAMANISPQLYEQPLAWWFEREKEFIDWCDILCVLKTSNYSKSKGIKGEMKYAKKIGKPIMFFPWR